MAGVIEAIGVISGLLGIIQFGIDNFSQPPGEGSTFKIAVGLDGTKGLSNAGGQLPDVRVWNQNGDFVGMTADPGKVKHGNLGEVHVDHENQGVYSLFSANNDAICIAWVTTTWSEKRGGGHYAVQGDMGYHCGANWFYSGMYPNSDEDQLNKSPEDQPKCFWIDKNGDQPSTGFQVRWPAFSRGEVDPDAPVDKRDPKKKCDGISFGIRTEDDPKSIKYWTRRRRGLLSAPEQAEHRQNRRDEALDSMLVVGDADGQSARFLCDSTTSVGPDFANSNERLFCDMVAKKIYPFCGGTEKLQTGCFDLESKTLKPETSQAAGVMMLKAEKKFDTTLDWRKNKTATAE